jgi:MFS family permease
VSEVLRSPAALGLILGSYAAGAVLGCIAFTALAPKLPRFRTFLVGVAISTAPLLLILLNHDLAVVLTVNFLAGIALSVVNPVLGALMYERIPAELQNRVFGLVAAVCYAGLPVGGVLGGVAVATLGLDPAILVAGLLCVVVTSAPVFWYRKRSADLPESIGQETNRR